MIKNLLFFVLLLMILGCEKNSIEKAKIFGTKEFISSKWIKADTNIKSKMIYSFLKNHDIRNMNNNDIHQLLGKSTAYYEYDEFPAYNLILNGRKYIIAFPVNRDTNKIRKYIFQPPLK